MFYGYPTGSRSALTALLRLMRPTDIDLFLEGVPPLRADITANKGGVGKDALTCALAWDLDHMRKRVLITDADVRQGHCAGILSARREGDIGRWGQEGGLIVSHTVPEPSGGRWDFVLVDHPPSLDATRLDLVQRGGCVPVVIYVLGSLRDIGGAPDAVRYLLHSGQAAQVWVLLNEATPDYALSSTLTQVREKWKPIKGATLLPHTLGHSPSLAADAGPEEWHPGYWEGAYDPLHAIHDIALRLIALRGRHVSAFLRKRAA